jgi:hypothetical protein
MDNDEDIPPPPKKMYKMLLAMASEVSDLKQKLEEAHAFVRKKVKKINIVDTLNRSTIQPVYSMYEMIRTESIDVEYLFQHSVFETIDKIFSRCIYLLPMAAFIQKPHTLYGFIRISEKNGKSGKSGHPCKLLTHLIQYNNKYFSIKINKDSIPRLRTRRCIDI